LALPARGAVGRTVAATDSALAVATDLDERPLVCVDAAQPVDSALTTMRDAGVRSAFVFDRDGALAGLVTAADIQGDKVLRRLHELGCTLHSCTRDDVKVADVMEPLARWQVVEWRVLAAGTVADVVRLLRASGRTHVPVLDRSADGGERLRGLISAAEVTRRSGLDTAGLPPATTFAEIEKTLHDGRAP
jgi:CBS domain-containing protein